VNASRTAAPPPEAALYGPVKALLEAQGYIVKGEIVGCDVVAVRGDEPPVVVELKRAFGLALVLQGIDRLAMTDAVYLAFNEFKSILSPRLNIKRLIPVIPPEQALHHAHPGGIVVPAWEPGSRGVLDTLLPRFIEDQIGHAYHESQAAEQAARMMAMDSATRNAGELIHKYFLVMNKIRQAGITKELLEIMTAVEALKK